MGSAAVIVQGNVKGSILRLCIFLIEKDNAAHANAAAAAAAAAAVEREGVLQADPEAHGGRQRGGARRHLREEAAGVRLARNELVTLVEEAAAGGADAGARRRGCRK